MFDKPATIKKELQPTVLELLEDRYPRHAPFRWNPYDEISKKLQEYLESFGIHTDKDENDDIWIEYIDISTREELCTLAKVIIDIYSYTT